MRWYLGAILVWWLISGILGGGISQYAKLSDVGEMIAVTAFFYAIFWLPYISWLAASEAVLFLTFPKRKALFFLFATVSFCAYAMLVFSSKWEELWPLFVWPAAVVTLIYMVRRLVRQGSHDDPAFTAKT